MAEYTNRLIHEKSPYLLQHAHNPVDWYPWGEEAFERAEKEDKPIFLSIGYATCHWCHVMERESFEREAIADVMNEAFVCVKVDREERPDVDSIYMTVCQLMTGSGGWPLTILMTPDRRPFFAGTYIPPQERFGRMGMMQLVPRIMEAWTERRSTITESSEQIMHALQQMSVAGDAPALDASLLIAASEALMERYDADRGGFGSAPKFPTPHQLIFLLRSDHPEALNVVKHTLEAIRLGGIYDQVGFGVHRYSTDKNWLVPHFEKMLYDQAMMVQALLETYERTQDAFYAETAREILTYVERDMMAPEGGFYSAEDADSEGEEGLFYIWSEAELMTIVGEEDFGWIKALWGTKANGNFAEEATRQKNGLNILHLKQRIAPADALRLDAIRKKLYEIREKRIHPLKDTKVLTDWNGLMISAFACAGRVLGEDRYIVIARKAAAFIDSTMRKPNGRLWHRWREGDLLGEGTLDDYATMIAAHIALYQIRFEISDLERAVGYAEIVEQYFYDKEKGGFYLTADDAEELIIRPKELYDGAIPSGNSVHLLNLLKLARLTGRSEFEQQAEATLSAFSAQIQKIPVGFTQALTAFRFATEPTEEIVVVGPKEDPQTKEYVELLWSDYRPSRMVLLKDPNESDTLTKLAPFTLDLEMKDGQPTVYVCRNFSCASPVNSTDDLKQSLCSSF